MFKKIYFNKRGFVETLVERILMIIVLVALLFAVYYIIKNFFMVGG